MDRNQHLTELLRGQIAKYGKETRFLEFKSNYQEAAKLGALISALSNGACLDKEDLAYLYFGVEDSTLRVIGTTFDISSLKAIGNQPLEMYLRQYITPKIDFTIEEFLYEGKTRVVVFTIPAAASEPVCFQRKPYIRVDSSVTELVPYTHWMRTIYNSRTDWTAQAVEDACIDDLDKDAMRMAREGYKERFPGYAEECDNWSDSVFLDKAKLTRNGQITRATLLLLGKNEQTHKLGHIAQMVWKCFQDGETFGDIYGIPFIKTSSMLFNRIRNYRFKIFPQDTLIPTEIWKYDIRSIHEGLHNCIAHQDYSMNERIIVTETKDRLTFENAGTFFDGDYEQYISGEKTPKRYRNPFLVQAMVNLMMIDTQGYGIHNMFLHQMERYLPMPDYEGSTDTHVTMHLPGSVIDENYSLTLLSSHGLGLTEAVLLDRVQKGMSISGDAIDMLRRKKLIEGRKPHVYISKSVARTTGKKTEYSKHKGLDKKSCEALLLEALRQHSTLTKGEISELLWSVLPNQLEDKQKKNKIDAVLKGLREEGRITNKTRGNKSVWSLGKE